MVATGAAALEVAERHGLAAPRLIAKDLDGRVAGVAASLETFVDGSTAWPGASSSEPPAGPRSGRAARPEAVSDRRDWGRVAGAALAQIHAVALAPQPHLPFRPRPIAVDDFAADRREGRMPTTPLLQRADELIRSMPEPRDATVFVHGDVWFGNLLWAGDPRCVFIDWKTAGVGDPGVDLGELRKQLAITYGPEATAGIVTGWEQATGRPATDVAYWDAVAALNTPTDLGPMTARRDAFLRSALAQLS
ncbi:phosphotransferase family protein [Kribbella sp. CA-247076]|uniref:phosphotransferase family protein n=1 Tax=Kribbella sp. CA-247076 TaxID=3239941 RepID=UPI003D8D362F